MPDTSAPPHDGHQEAAAEAPATPGDTGVTPFEVIHVDSPVVACDGGDGALGHPRVWLRIVARQIVCPYCSRCYVLNDGVASDPGH